MYVYNCIHVYICMSTHTYVFVSHTLSISPASAAVYCTANNVCLDTCATFIAAIALGTIAHVAASPHMSTE